MTAAPTPSAGAGVAERVRPSPWVPLLAAIGCALGVYASFALFVGTLPGQRLDALAFDGSRIGAWRVSGTALNLLRLISNSAVVLIIAIVMVVAVLRRQWLLSLEAAAVVVAANVTSQILKYWAFERTDMMNNYGLLANNSLPSGHTTVAASAVIAGLLVVPVRLRQTTALVGSICIVAFGYATLVGQWHRPSDVVAAILLSFGWGYMALATERFRRRARPQNPVYDVTRRPVFSPNLLLIAGAVGGLAALGALGLSANESYTEAGRSTLVVAYAGGAAAVVSLTALLMALFLRLQAVPMGESASSVE